MPRLVSTRAPALLPAALLGALLAGCPKAEEGAGTKPAEVPSPEAWTPAHTQQVEATCSRCHQAPPPDALPRASFEEWIPRMPTMPVPSGVQPLGVDELALALTYYQRNAPPELAWVPPEPALSETLRFRVERFSPQRREVLDVMAPAVSNVQFVHLSDPRRCDLLISEMRSRALNLLAPWAPEQQRKVRHLASELNYNAHVELVDVNRDGRLDLLVAALGDMNPSNEVRGSVILLLQDERRRFQRHVLRTGLGRVADARASDFDGDGDLDLMVAVFGWRGPGQLLLLENQTRDWARPRFETHELDDRDGYSHLEPVDLDGDGRLDFVALLSQQHEQVLVYLNRGGLRFDPLVLFQAPHPAWGFSGMNLVDLDRDGDLDVLLAHGDTLDDDLLKPYHGTSWLENEGELRFSFRSIVPLFGCEAAVASDLDRDGDLDVVAVAFLPQIDPTVWRELQLDSVIWAERTSDGWRRHSLEKERCYHPTVSVADYDADGKPDIAVGSWVWIMEGAKPTARSDYLTLFTAQ